MGPFKVVRPFLSKYEMFRLYRGAILFYFFAMLRLDFDGDLFTHWLQSANTFYWAGHKKIRVSMKFVFLF